jgi:hypothetical protein
MPMKTIWKFPITESFRAFSISMPRGATYLHFGEQSGAMQLWMLVDPAAPLRVRQFRIADDSVEDDDFDDYVHVGSGPRGNLGDILHLFEKR